MHIEYMQAINFQVNLTEDIVTCSSVLTPKYLEYISHRQEPLVIMPKTYNSLGYSSREVSYIT